MKFGTEILRNGVRFRLWAPRCETVSLRLVGHGDDLPMDRHPRGWFELEVEEAAAGDHYSFVLPDGLAVPDPASRFQPEDVHGPSEVIDPQAFAWHDRGWRGCPWEETIFYELHVGTFTAEGTFRAAIDRLDHLVSLGVTAVELMPVNAFPGRWNWGYDGVLLFAPDQTYGRPEDLKALVQAAHDRGLMVFLDVVYNHFGPRGNYMDIYAPQLTDRHDTPWGRAVNFDDEDADMMRDFVVANARYWLNEYRFDGLRLDAVHEIRDSGTEHILADLARQVRAATDGRHTHLVDENCENETRWLARRPDQRPLLYTAQWSDDIHHSLHTISTGETITYYAEFAGPIDLVARSLADGLGYQGEVLQELKRPRGEPAKHLPPTAFVSFIQNHDHVGNRPYGERLHLLAPPQAVRTLAAINLLSPHIPLLFMGEEWASDRPFLFFSDVGDDLADAVRKGQKEQNKAFPIQSARPVPDPMARSTFDSCKLDWDRVDEPAHAASLALYRQLIALRQEEIVPRLRGIGGHAGRYELLGERAIRVWWQLGDNSVLTLSANLSDRPLAPGLTPAGRLVWQEGEWQGDMMGPWAVAFTLKSAADNP